MGRRIEDQLDRLLGATDAMSGHVSRFTEMGVEKKVTTLNYHLLGHQRFVKSL